MTADPEDFPRLTPDNHRVVGPEDPTYNCVAWAAGDNTRWWQPGWHWLPPDCSRDDHGMGALEGVFLRLGYADCDLNASLEPGFLKVALYGTTLMYTHAARQLPDGTWTSKLGGGILIAHDTPDAVAGGVYHSVMQVMRRPVDADPAGQAKVTP